MKMNIGIWIGLSGALLGLIVAVISVYTSSGEFGIYYAAILVAIFGSIAWLFYKLFFAPMLLSNRLQKTGISGKALILEVKDTGVTINNSPQVKLVLELKNSFGQKYSATLKTLVSRLQPDMFRPGMTVPVKIDPENEKIMVIDLTGEHPIAEESVFPEAKKRALQAEMEKLDAELQSIRLTGKSARAIIKNYQWLGVYVNGNNPYAELELEVLPDDEPAFQGTVRGTIMEESVAKYQPGKIIFVKYDPADHKRISLDHS